MSQVGMIILSFLSGLVSALVVYWALIKIKRGGLVAQSTQIIKDAEVEKERILRAAEVEAKNTLLRMQQDNDRDLKKQREELGAVEKRLRQREINVERKSELLEKSERDLRKRETSIEAGEERCKSLLQEAEGKAGEIKRELERVANLSAEEARKELIRGLEDQAKHLAASQIKRLEEEARLTAEEQAKKIIANSINRFAGEFVSERAVSVVELPSDEMKGRIIGREGRNIRAIEAATGVEVIIDDTPEVVILSSFNPVRREIAKMALELLVADGRIHPARIEEVVAKATGEIEQLIVKTGEQATFDLGLHGLHPELIKMVGRSKYHSFGGQNLWAHSLEVAAIAGMIASELGLNAMLAKRVGLLHDIGKVVDHEVEGDHAHIGAEQARRFGEKPQVVEAIREHHHAEPSTILGVLLQAADTISKTRPGARRDLREAYIKRLENLEQICKSFAGVERAYVIQAGREVRVIVDYTKIADEQAFLLSKDIAAKIERELTYPGEVRVTVLREARAMDIAR